MCASSSLAEGTVNWMRFQRSGRRDGEPRANGADDAVGRVRARVIFKAIAIAGTVAMTIVGRRRGYGFGGRTFVRCRRGHLFTTIWIPGASIKAVRLGWWRFQRCPVGRHWTLVVPVKETELTHEEREQAVQNRDRTIP